MMEAAEGEPRGMEFDTDVLGQIGRAAAAAYPCEGCGALLGPRREPRRVTAMIPLENREEGTPRVRFEISPRDYMDVEREAERRGMDLLGFWHSHPDHPARPSPTDRSFAWEGLLTVIVSVRKGGPSDIEAWEIPAPGELFGPVEIRRTGTASLVSSLAVEPGEGGP